MIKFPENCPSFWREKEVLPNKAVIETALFVAGHLGIIKPSKVLKSVGFFGLQDMIYNRLNIVSKSHVNNFYYKTIKTFKGDIHNYAYETRVLVCSGLPLVSYVWRADKAYQLSYNTLSDARKDVIAMALEKLNNKLVEAGRKHSFYGENKQLIISKKLDKFMRDNHLPVAR